MFRHLFVHSDDFRIARQVADRCFYLFPGKRRGVAAHELLEFLVNPGSLNDLFIASRSVLTISAGVPGGNTYGQRGYMNSRNRVINCRSLSLFARESASGTLLKRGWNLPFGIVRVA